MNSQQKMILKIILEERDLDSRPTIHPNGFVQLKLTNGQRMHFWHPEIPRQQVGSPIHDHTFDMYSEILLGTLFHREISVSPDSEGYYVIWEAMPIRDTETVLVSTDKRVRADHRIEQELRPGDHYSLPAFSFHLTRDAVPAVSVITKRQQYAGLPRVLVPAGKEADNDFVRDSFDPAFCEKWMLRIVEEA